MKFDSRGSAWSIVVRVFLAAFLFLAPAAVRAADEATPPAATTPVTTSATNTAVDLMKIFAGAHRSRWLISRPCRNTSASSSSG